MKPQLEVFGLRRQSDWLSPSHRSFRPPSWPPPRDWVVSEDRGGNVLSVWGDPTWDITPWAGRSMILDFGDVVAGTRRKASSLTPANADLLRMVATWRMWGTRACVAANTLKGAFLAVRRVIALCNDNRIVASELMHFPKVFEKLATAIPASEFSKTILELHRLWDARDVLGFVLVDVDGIKRLSVATPAHEIEQTAYIPPRIWTYQVLRLKACLDEFTAHQDAVGDCYMHCLHAYANAYGSLNLALASNKDHHPPFGQKTRAGYGSISGRTDFGRFEFTAARFGVGELISRWTGIPTTELEVRTFALYLSLVQNAGLAYIANFSLQRVSEVASLRADCLIWEQDEKLGRVPIICGETTKTEADSDARWPTSPTVEVAVNAMARIAQLRMICAAADPVVNPSHADKLNPYLLSPSSEPWTGTTSQPYWIRPHPNSYGSLIDRFPFLFDPEQLRITDDDLRIARMLTPNLSEEKGFVVGQAWPFAWHQLRRTGAVNMFCSGLLSDSSLQFQMKHASRLMPLYYGRGYTKLQLNAEVEETIVRAMYEAMASKILAAVSDRFVSPLGQQRKETILVNLVGQQDAKQLAAAGKKGLIFFRETRCGGCANGMCGFGGVESLSRCAGGDGGGPCADALYDTTKADGMEQELKLIDEEIAREPEGSLRRKALLAERQGVENFLNVVKPRKRHR